MAPERDYPYLYGYARATIEVAVDRMESKTMTEEEVMVYLKEGLERLAEYGKEANLETEEE